MKVTLINSFMLMVFASILASCQRPKYYKSGHLSTFSFQTRSIASFNDQDLYKNFLTHQDPKQIIIYCKLNSKKPQTCYRIHLKKSLSKFSKRYKNVQVEQLNLLTEQLAYKQQEGILESLTQKILLSEKEHIGKLIHKRKIFCYKNSKKDIERCLKQYLNNDTFSVLNKYQSQNKLNGLEHNYFITKIKSLLQESYEQAKQEIEQSRSKVI